MVWAWNTPRSFLGIESLGSCLEIVFTVLLRCSQASLLFRFWFSSTDGKSWFDDRTFAARFLGVFRQRAHISATRSHCGKENWSQTPFGLLSVNVNINLQKLQMCSILWLHWHHLVSFTTHKKLSSWCILCFSNPYGSRPTIEAWTRKHLNLFKSSYFVFWNLIWFLRGFFLKLCWFLVKTIWNFSLADLGRVKQMEMKWFWV